MAVLNTAIRGAQIQDVVAGAGLSKDAKVIVYRRTKYPNDNLYNPTTYRNSLDLSLIDLPMPEVLTSNGAGFYYIWPPAVSK